MREYAFWLERELADTYRVRAFREAAAIAEGLEETPTGEAAWRSLRGFGPKTAAIAAEAAAGRLPEALARRRVEGAVSLDPAGTNSAPSSGGPPHPHHLVRRRLPAVGDDGSGEALGHEYMAITDHSPRLKVARGLTRERLIAQWEEIAAVQEDREIRILKGIEVDILADGALDQADDLLDRLDIVTASVHSDLDADRDTMTRRMVGAVSNRHTTVLGHPTGRRLRPDGTWRDQSRFDAELVFAACAMFGVAVEINSRPERRDPPLDLLLVAREADCLFSIDSDAHAPGQLDFLTYGAARAVEAGIAPERIITTWPLERLLGHAGRHR
nr:PHP domain-containing protein [Tessaracoccus coleopterorum]